ncbi:MAG: phage terminase large subunit [Proteobacteria bacterium]|nr:phage terminase large subunit [Pseudomonadota bacterium]
MLNEAASKRGTKLAIAAPRGSAKSTLVTLQYVIYCICYRVESFIVIISNTSDQAQGFLGDIKRELESNEKLMKDFPEACETGAKPAPPRWTQKEILTKNGIKIIALGAEQQMRGRRNKEHRPSLIIMDDIEQDNSVQNPESYYKLQDWLDKAVLKSGTSNTNMVFIGTIHHYGSLLAKFTSADMYQGWKKMIYRSIISWADNISLWEEWKNIFCNRNDYEGESGIIAAKNFFEANREEMLKGAVVLWSESKGYYDLMVLREEEGHISFDSEMQNEPINPRDCIFNQDDVQYWDDKFDTDMALIEYLKNNNFSTKVFAGCDPSLGKSKRRGDYSAVICVLYDIKNAIAYVLDADLEKRDPEKTIVDILTLHKKRKFDYLAFESNGFQSIIADQITKRSSEQNNHLKVEKVENKTDKRARIESLQPLIKNGLIQFSRKQRILLEQLKYYPKGSHDDGIDALQIAYDLCQQKGKTRDMAAEIAAVAAIMRTNSELTKTSLGIHNPFGISRRPFDI